MKIVWILLGLGVLALVIKAGSGEAKDRSKSKKPSNRPLLQDKPKVVKKWEPAEIAFERNLQKIVPLLRGVTKDGISNIEDWNSVVISIDNDELTDMWKTGANRPEMWVTYLQTFGLQVDWVEAFECIEEHKEMYYTNENESPEVGVKYVVTSPCWIYTNESNQKSVILKGIVRQKEIV